jgi:condensin complex subunit 1
LEIYGFLLQWAVFGLEQREASEKESSGISASTGRKGKGKSKPNSNRNWDSTGQLKATLEVMCKVLKLKLLRIFVTTSERETFVNLYTKPAYLILESEKWVKNTEIRMHVFKVICIAVKHHGHAFGKFFFLLSMSSLF